MPRPSTGSPAAIWKAPACRPSRAEGARWLERARRPRPCRGPVAAGRALRARPGRARAARRGKAQAGRLFAAEEQAGPDFESALRWARRAAEAGSAQGQALLAYVLTERAGGDARSRGGASAGMSAPPPAGSPEGRLGYALSLAPRTQRCGRAGARSPIISAAPPGRCCRRRSICWGCWPSRASGWHAIRRPPLELYRNAAELGVRSAQLAGVWR